MRKVFAIVVVSILILFEFLRVYLIMPMPGSQHFDSIELAYFLGSNKWTIRLIAYLIILNPLILVIKNGVKKERVILGSLTVVYFIFFYVFTFQMEADKMFYQPSKVETVSIKMNKIPMNKLVIGVVIDSFSRAYPIQLIGYHHQVADTINGKSIMVTYCTVCRTGRVFSPIVNGKIEKFRLVGMDHFNAMFEDATTKSWWRQSNGECIAGPLKGYKLAEIKSEQLALSAWVRVQPNTKILQPDSNFKEKFEKMDSYDKGKSKGELTRRDTASWKAKSWILGIQNGFMSKAYDWNLITNKRIIQDTISNMPILILLESDTASFHTFDRRVENLVLNFNKKNDSIWDYNTGSIWNYDGVCIDGKLNGMVLKKVPSYQEFLHSWEFFHPKSTRYQLR